MFVIQVGVYPPPVGGTTIHNQRLAMYCQHQGVGTLFIDPYGLNDASGRGPVSPPVYRLGGSLLARYLRMRRLIRVHRRALVHVKASTFGALALTGFPLLTLLRDRPKIISIGAGNFDEVYERSARWRQLLIQRILRCFDCLVVTHSEHASYIAQRFGVAAHRIHVIPSFIPPMSGLLEGCEALIKQVRDLREWAGPLVVACGQLLDFYGFDTLMTALKILRGHGMQFGFIVAVYHGLKPPDQGLDRRLIQHAAALGNGLILRGLESEAFVRLLNECRVFVRTTTMEGDSNALREAAAAGLQIIASDCAPRPAGVALFPTGNAEALANEIRRCLSDPQHGVVQEHITGNGDRFIAIYRALWTAKYGSIASGAAGATADGERVQENRDTR